MSNNKPKLVTPVFRVAFPLLTNPETRSPSKYGDGKVNKKYSVTAIWRPADFTEAEQDQWRILLTELDDAAKHTFNKSLKELSELNAEGGSYRLIPRNGATKDQAGFGEGTKFATLNANWKPNVVDKDRNVITDIVEAIYPGCYCRASVRAYAFDNAGKGVALGLNNIQKVADGDRLDTGGDAGADFDAPFNFKPHPEAQRKQDDAFAEFEKLAKGIDDVPF